MAWVFSSLVRNLFKLIYLIDSAARIRYLRILIRYVANILKGLHFEFNALCDEAALALYLANSSRKDHDRCWGKSRRLVSVFLQGQPNIEKLIIVEPQALH